MHQGLARDKEYHLGPKRKAGGWQNKEVGREGAASGGACRQVGGEADPREAPVRLEGRPSRLPRPSTPRPCPPRPAPPGAGAAASVRVLHAKLASDLATIPILNPLGTSQVGGRACGCWLEAGLACAGQAPEGRGAGWARQMLPAGLRGTESVRQGRASGRYGVRCA